MSAYLCFFSQEQHRNRVTKKKGLEAERKEILFHCIEGDNIQNAGEKILLTREFKRSSAKSKLLFFRKK